MNTRWLAVLIDDSRRQFGRPDAMPSWSYALLLLVWWMSVALHLPVLLVRTLTGEFDVAASAAWSLALSTGPVALSLWYDRNGLQLLMAIEDWYARRWADTVALVRETNGAHP